MFLLVQAHRVVPDKGQLNGCVCVRIYEEGLSL